MADPKWLEIFTGITAFAFLVQAIVMVALGIAVFGAIKKVMALLNDVQKAAMPLIQQATPMVATARGVVDDIAPKIKDVVSDVAPRVKDVAADLSPKIKTISANFVHISDTARRQAENISGTVEDANERTHRQVQRVDTIITSTLDGLHNASRSFTGTVNNAVEGLQSATRSVTGSVNSAVGSIQSAMETPLKRASGVWASVTTTLESLKSSMGPGRSGSSRPGRYGSGSRYSSTSGSGSDPLRSQAESLRSAVKPIWGSGSQGERSDDPLSTSPYSRESGRGSSTPHRPGVNEPKGPGHMGSAGSGGDLRDDDIIV